MLSFEHALEKVMKEHSTAFEALMEYERTKKEV